MIRKIMKRIWDIRWVIIISFAMISSVITTIQNFISKNYDAGFYNLMIVLLFVLAVLLMWSRAESEKLIDLQDEIIDSQDEIIKQNEKLIAKQSKLINEVTKVLKESTQKGKTNKKTAENQQKNRRTNNAKRIPQNSNN